MKPQSYTPGRDLLRERVGGRPRVEPGRGADGSRRAGDERHERAVARRGVFAAGPRRTTRRARCRRRSPARPRGTSRSRCTTRRRRTVPGTFSGSRRAATAIVSIVASPATALSSSPDARSPRSSLVACGPAAAPEAAPDSRRPPAAHRADARASPPRRSAPAPAHRIHGRSSATSPASSSIASTSADRRPRSSRCSSRAGTPGRAPPGRWTASTSPTPRPPASSRFSPTPPSRESVEARTHTGDVRVRTPGVQVGIALPQPLERWTGGASVGEQPRPGRQPSGGAGRPPVLPQPHARRAGAGRRRGRAAAARPPLAVGRRGAPRRSSRTSLPSTRTALSTTSFAGQGAACASAARTCRCSRCAARRSRTSATRRSPRRPRRAGGNPVPRTCWPWTRAGTPGGIALTARVSALRSGFRLEPRGGTAERHLRGLPRRRRSARISSFET